MIRKLRNVLPLSDAGFSSLRLGILASTLREIAGFLPFIILYRMICLVMKPLGGGTFDTAAMMRLFFWGAAAAVLMLISAWLADHLNNIPTYREMDRMRREAAQRLAETPMSFLNARSSGDLVNHLMADCASCEVVMSGLIPGLISQLLAMLTVLATLSFVNWKLTLAMFSVIPLAYLIQALTLRLQARMSRQQLQIKRRAEDTLLDYLEGMPVIKACNLTGSQFDRLREDLDAVRRISTRLELTASIFISSAEVLLQLGIGIVMLAGAFLLSRADVTLPVLLLFFAVVLRLYEPVASSLGELSALVYMKATLERLRQLFSAQTAKTDVNLPEAFDVTFSQVSFRYRDDGPNVLHDLSFCAPDGAVTAIVGPSGEGKTTTLRLASCLWEPTEGSVQIGGKDLHGTAPEALAPILSVVDQDVVLFHDTVLNNIRIGNPDASRETVIAAAEAAQCGAFVSRLPDGYDTVLAENGLSLSGGERQRISIARAILKDAPVLILDEPTSALDPENEALVQTALSHLLRRGKTVLMVAHRLKTIQNADQILVLVNGTISECGHHDELMCLGGTYRRMYDLQAQAEEWTAQT